jgi:hypothetical protein
MLGIDFKDVAEVYLLLQPNEAPKVAIIKYITDSAVADKQTDFYRLVPIES